MFRNMAKELQRSLNIQRKDSAVSMIETFSPIVPTLQSFDNAKADVHLRGFSSGVDSLGQLLSTLITKICFISFAITMAVISIKRPAKRWGAAEDLQFMDDEFHAYDFSSARSTWRNGRLYLYVGHVLLVAALLRCLATKERRKTFFIPGPVGKVVGR